MVVGRKRVREEEETEKGVRKTNNINVVVGVCYREKERINSSQDLGTKASVQG